MLYLMNKLTGLSLRANDGEIGKVIDVYFDDQNWAVRYLVIETGSWLNQRKVLVSPIAIRDIDWDARAVDVWLSRAQVKNSPDIDTDKPVSRQHEVDFLSYYGYPDYWSGLLLWGSSPYPLIPMTPLMTGTPVGEVEASSDPHLRSAEEIAGYHIEASDDSIGHVEDFLLDSESWAIRYIVVDTRNWWPGKHVVIPPKWIRRLDWANKMVNLDVSRDTVKRAAEYDPEVPFSRAHEKSLYRQSERPVYWQ